MTVSDIGPGLSLEIIIRIAFALVKQNTNKTPASLHTHCPAQVIVSVESCTLKLCLVQTDWDLNVWHSRDYQSINCGVLCQCLQVTQATNQIVMNCADIDIITASFAPQGGEGEGQTMTAFSPLFVFVNDSVTNENIVCKDHI